MQLRTGQDFHRVELGFSSHAQQTEQAKLVDDFATMAAAIMVIVNVEDILHGDGQGS